MGYLRYKGYTGRVEYSEADNCFVGTVIGLKNTGIIYEGDSVESLRKDFEEAIDYYIEDCKSNGKEPEKPFSGKLIVRMTPLLHSEAAERASAMGISLNEFINRAVKTAVL
ncbi:MAG: type II toxin-antitoxin system HicB family antitoxin [Bacteroidales bacterium]|nr:type II toxin-antitoxin system HicB family antitoxin [Bacteroidales bacterium]